MRDLLQGTKLVSGIIRKWTQIFCLQILYSFHNILTAFHKITKYILQRKYNPRYMYKDKNGGLYFVYKQRNGKLCSICILRTEMHSAIMYNKLEERKKGRKEGRKKNIISIMGFCFVAVLRNAVVKIV